MLKFEQEASTKRPRLRFEQETYQGRFTTRTAAQVSGPPALTGPRGLQPSQGRGGSLLKFTPEERAREENFYRGKDGTGASPAGQKPTNNAKDIEKGQRKGLSAVDAARGAIDETASKVMSKEAKKSENYAIMTADDGRVAGRTYAKAGRWVERRYSGNRPVRVDKRAAKKGAKQRIGLEKEKLYEMRTGKQAPSALKRQRKQMKRKQIRGLAEKTLGVKRTDFLVRFAKKAGELAARAGAALFSWIGIPAIAAVALVAITFFFASMLFNFITNAAVVTMSSYTSEDADIEAASLLVTQLEAKLEQEIAGIPSAWEWAHIDEFRYFVEDIEHDPFELMAWLSVRYPGFKMDAFSPVQLAISDLHKRRYKLELDEVVETRTDTETHIDPITGEVVEEEYEYSYYILNVYLTSRTIESAVRPFLQDAEGGDLWEWYGVLMATGGARQEFANPFPGLDWRDYTTSLYGYRVDPINKRNMQIHRGLDIALPTGTPITAGLTGRVTYVGYDTTFGNYIILQDDKGAELKYAHCHRAAVIRGDQVVAGETVIGTVGNSGASTGSHLHIEAKRDGKYLNPIFVIAYEEVPKK